jgi:hypothetical protein
MVFSTAMNTWERTTFATSTGEEAEGDAQHSFHNIERYGFRRTHARANWVPAV